MSTSGDWLTNLKPGDQIVIEFGRFPESSNGLARVERLTATQVVVTSPWSSRDPLRFRRDDGLSVENPGQWSARDRIVEATEERVAEIRYRALAEKIGRTNWRKQSREVLDAVAVALNLPPVCK